MTSSAFNTIPRAVLFNEHATNDEYRKATGEAGSFTYTCSVHRYRRVACVRGLRNSEDL